MLQRGVFGRERNGVRVDLVLDVVARLVYLAVDLGANRVEVGLRDDTFLDEKYGEVDERIVLLFLGDVFGRAVETLVIFARVAAVAKYRAVQHGRLAFATNPVDGFAGGRRALDRIAPIHFVEPDELLVSIACEQIRQAAARRVFGHVGRDGPAVVFDAKEHRTRVNGVGREIQCFPELALARGAVAGANVDDLFGVPEVGAILPLGHGGVEQARVAQADPRQELGAHRAGAGENSAVTLAEVVGQLTAGGSGLLGGANGRRQNLPGRNAAMKRDDQVPVMRHHPVDAGPHVQRHT